MWRRWAPPIVRLSSGMAMRKQPNSSSNVLGLQAGLFLSAAEG